MQYSRGKERENLNSIVYLGFASPDDIQAVVNNYDTIPHLATNKFSWAIVRSLIIKFDIVENFSTCDIRNYPAGKKIIFKSRYFKIENINGFFIGFINIIILKHLTRMLTLLMTLPKVAIRNRGQCMLIHGSHTPYMIAAIICKWLFSSRICIILTDQHGVEVSSDGWFGRIGRHLDTMLMRLMIGQFDAFICLSIFFVNKFNLINYKIIPGIINENIEILKERDQLINRSREIFIVAYGGGISKENGIDALLESFKAINNESIHLVLYGSGPLVCDVLIHAKSDKRIIYGGILYGQSLYKALQSADLLINPRPIGSEYAASSFPSKLLDYMTTGIPTLTTRLLSIPQDISDCFYYIQGNNDKAIAEAIIHVSSKSPEQRFSLGKKAYEKASKLYSSEAFAQNIYDILVLK